MLSTETFVHATTDCTHHVLDIVMSAPLELDVQVKFTQFQVIKLRLFQSAIFVQSILNSLYCQKTFFFSIFFSIFSWNFSIHLIADMSSRLFHSKLSSFSFICFGVSGLPSFPSIPSTPFIQSLPSFQFNPSLPSFPGSHLGHISHCIPCSHCMPCSHLSHFSPFSQGSHLIFSTGHLFVSSIIQAVTSLWFILHF